MGKLVKVLCACVFSLCFIAGLSFAQEVENTATEAEMYFASGSVIEASATKIVIAEYDFDAGQETNVEYEVNVQTQFEGAAGAADIKKDDDVEIEYQVSGDKKIATRVEKYAAEDTENVENMESDETVETPAPMLGTQKEDRFNEMEEQDLNNEAEQVETGF
jgi:hypothetical protein